MEITHRTFFERLPQVIEKNAQPIMKRVIDRTRTQLESSGQAAGGSHGLLFLKVGEADMVDAFVAATRARFAAEVDDLAGLSLEPEEGPRANDDFAAADKAFAKLRANTRAHGAGGLDRYGSEAFLAAMLDAFQHSRMDARATAELMPCARAALNTELQAFYVQLDALVTRAAQV